MDQFLAVITTIQGPTPSVRRLAEVLKPSGVPLLIIGDSKGPHTYDLDGADLWSLERQKSLPWKIASLLPTKHYVGKNLGYLIAMDSGAGCIYETDDDNTPMTDWTSREIEVPALSLANSSWINVYRCFSDDNIWPRGFPLEFIRSEKAMPRSIQARETRLVHAPIQQGLANNSPDVDAVWRLVLDREFTFNQGPSVLVGPGAWCPFNKAPGTPARARALSPLTRANQ